MTNLQDDENMRLNQSIQKMQERLDETYLRASDTKQMGRAIIKNTEDLLRGSIKDQRDFEVIALVFVLAFDYEQITFRRTTSGVVLNGFAQYCLQGF